MLNKYNKHNFHSYTFCIWKEVRIEEVKDLKINFKSKSGSQYIFTSDGLYRISNHWGRVANCYWRLISLTQFKNQNTTIAYAKWTDFYATDATSKIFYIKVNTSTQEVNFYHKNSLENNEKVVVRNSTETAKIIKIIKDIFVDDSWSKYLKYENIDVLRNEIINELINTEKNLIVIKRNYLY